MKNTSMVYISSLRDKIFTKSVFLTMAVALVVGGFFVANSVLAAGPVFIDTNVNGILDLGEDSFDTIQAAIDASSIIMAVPDTIVLSSDITISSAVNVDRAVTINGAGYHLNANFTKTSNSNNAAIHIIYPDVTIKNLIIDGTEGGQVWNLQLHGINIYQSEGINLDTVSILNFGGAGIIVNGSTVTATNLNTSNNIWGAVNVDPGNGVTTASVFTLNSGNLAEDNQIWSDGAHISGSATVTVKAEGYSEYKLAGTAAYFVWAIGALTNVATINSDPATLYTSIQAAIDAASEGDTINVAAGTYNESINITKPLTLNGAKVGVDARTRDTSSGESILDGTGFTTAQYSLIMIANGVSDVVIDGFEFKNILLTSTGGGEGNAISSYCKSSSNAGANNITIKNNYIHDLGYNGILVVSENTTGTSMIVQSGWTIQYNKITSYRYAGIELTNVVNSQVKDNDIAAPTSIFDDPDDAGVGIEIAARSRSKPVTAGTNVEVSGNTITGTFPIGSRAVINLLSRTYALTSDATLSGVTVSGNDISDAINVRAAILAVAEVRSDGPATINNLAITGNILDGNLDAIEIRDYVKSGSGTASHSSVTITGNDIKNSTGIGLYLPASTLATGITVNSNKILTNALFGIKNEGTGTLDATNNWWGHPSGPKRETPGNSGIWVGKGDKISGYIDVIPWYANPDALTGGGTMTSQDLDIILGSGGVANLPNGITNLILSNNSNLNLFAGLTGLSGNVVTLNSGDSSSSIVITNSSNPVDFSASIPNGTKITGPSGWDGIITPPTSKTPSGNAPAGFSVGSTVIYVGSSQGTLTFDNPVTLLLPGVTGAVGYRPFGLDTTWVQITDACTVGSYDSPTGAVSPDECAISNGTDTKILTYHFTSFGSLVATPTPTPAPTPASSSGGYYPSTPKSTPAGEVLGITTFNFTANLQLGMEGNDITELQKRLTVEGVYSGPITGYFGPLTFQAVKTYQNKVGVPATGFVGPLTRGQLNAGQVAGASTVNVEAIRTQIASIQAQLISLIQQLIQMLQADLQAQQ